MELYKVPKCTWVRIIDEQVSVPPARTQLQKQDVIFFDHIDGMYSFCHDQQGNIVHMAAWTEVEPVSDEEADMLNERYATEVVGG